MVIVLCGTVVSVAFEPQHQAKLSSEPLITVCGSLASRLELRPATISWYAIHSYISFLQIYSQSGTEDEELATDLWTIRLRVACFYVWCKDEGLWRCLSTVHPYVHCFNSWFHQNHTGLL